MKGELWELILILLLMAVGIWLMVYGAAGLL
jgi:hypothetical protein